MHKYFQGLKQKLAFTNCCESFFLNCKICTAQAPHTYQANSAQFVHQENVLQLFDVKLMLRMFFLDQQLQGLEGSLPDLRRSLLPHLPGKQQLCDDLNITDDSTALFVQTVGVIGRAMVQYGLAQTGIQQHLQQGHK